MSNIAGIDMIKALLINECFASTSRFHWKNEDYKSKLQSLIESNPEYLSNLFFSIGASSEDLRILKEFCHKIYLTVLNKLPHTNYKFNLLIDVAHANSIAVSNFMKNNTFDEFNIFIGNYFGHEYKEFDRLYSLGIKGIRVGIGQGGSCLTTNGTTFGLPTLTSVYLADRWRREKGINPSDFIIIADGGITGPGDIIKCLHFGANIVCLGSYLSDCKERPGRLKRDWLKFGKPYKEFYGMSSHKSIKERVGLVREGISSEGLVKKVYIKTEVAHKVSDFASFLRSAISYAGVETVDHLHHKCDFEFISPSVAAYNASKDEFLRKY